MNRLTEFHFTVGKVGWYLFLLNLYWVFFTILGLIIFGVSPATDALYTILVEDERKGDFENKGLFRKFFYHYKNNFWKSNKLILPLIFFLLFLISELNLLREYHFLSIDSLIFSVLKWVSFAFTVFGLNVLWFGQFENSNRNVYKKSIILLLGKPFLTLMNFLLCLVTFSIYYLYPGIIIVFGGSLFFYLQVKLFSAQTFIVNLEKIAK